MKTELKFMRTSRELAEIEIESLYQMLIYRYDMSHGVRQHLNSSRVNTHTHTQQKGPN